MTHVHNHPFVHSSNSNFIMIFIRKKKSRSIQSIKSCTIVLIKTINACFGASFVKLINYDKNIHKTQRIAQ